MVSTFEKTGRIMSIKSPGRTEQVDSVAAVRATLEAAGVEFTNGGVPGVRLRKADQ